MSHIMRVMSLKLELHQQICAQIVVSIIIVENGEKWQTHGEMRCC